MLVQLETLDHQKKGHRGISKPYLWVIFFKVDGEGMRITKDFRLSGEATFKFSPGSHGNLKAGNVTEGQRIRIPKEVGSWGTSLKPMTVPYFEQSIVPGFMGVLTVLLTQDNVSNTGMEAGHRALNKHVSESVNELLYELHPRMIDLMDPETSLKEYFTSASVKYFEGMEKKIAEAIKANQNIVQNFWSLINRDDLVGHHLWLYNAADFKLKEWLEFSHEWTSEKHGDWVINGRFYCKSET